MKPEDIIITPPDGYEIDEANSTLGHIKFKPRKLTYSDVAKALFKDKSSYYTDAFGIVTSCKSKRNCDNPNTFCSEEQGRKLMALNKLINVANYLNGDWKPVWDNSQANYNIKLVGGKLEIQVGYVTNTGMPCFKTEKLAEQAIEILGEETIKLALS